MHSEAMFYIYILLAYFLCLKAFPKMSHMEIAKWFSSQKVLHAQDLYFFFCKFLNEISFVKILWNLSVGIYIGLYPWIVPLI